MALADVFVFPSLFEGSAVVTYEALASGLPSVVTSNAGSVVRDGIEGFVVPCGNVESLAPAVEQLGQSPELRARMASAARIRALAFDWPRYHKSLVTVVEDMLGSCDEPEARRIRPFKRATVLPRWKPAIRETQSHPFCIPAR